MNIVPTTLQAEVVQGAIPLDLVALGVLIFTLLLLSMSGGKRFFIPFLISLYVAEAVVSTLPSLRTFLLRFGATLPSVTAAIFFLLAVILTTWFLGGSAVTALFRLEGKGLRVWWQGIVASLLGAGLFGVLFLRLLPEETFKVSAIVKTWLLGDPFAFLWVLAPITFLVFLRIQRPAR